MLKRLMMCVAACLIVGSQANAQLNPEPEFRLVASGFSSSVQVRFPPDGTGRMFVVEQGGLIRIVENGATLPTPFLNVSALVSGGSEQGLLGMAFHPDFANNDTFFINYTDNSGDTNVVRYQVSAGDPNIADAGSADPIIEIEQDFSNHNAGDLAFGLDGYLYIGLGDGGSGNDPRNRAQTIAPNPNNCTDDDSCSLLGSFIRIDVDGSSRNERSRGGGEICGQVENYSIPADNPFAGTDGVCDEIWTYGWRNPFRFSVDRMTGDLFVGDVGQGAMEEISFMIAGDTSGRNFEWSCMEGTLNNPSGNPCSGPGTQTPPIIPVPRSEGGPINCSIIGGYRFRGPSLRAQGIYFFADFCSGRIWYGEDQGGGNWNRIEISDEPLSNPASFGEDEDGQLYVVDLGGSIYLLEFEDIFDDGFETNP